MGFQGKTEKRGNISSNYESECAHSQGVSENKANICNHVKSMEISTKNEEI